MCELITAIRNTDREHHMCVLRHITWNYQPKIDKSHKQIAIILASRPLILMAFRINSELKFQSVHKHLIMNNCCCSPLRQCSGLISRGESSCNNEIFKTTDIISCARTHNNTHLIKLAGIVRMSETAEWSFKINIQSYAVAQYYSDLIWFTLQICVTCVRMRLINAQTSGRNQRTIQNMYVIYCFVRFVILLINRIYTLCCN